MQRVKAAGGELGEVGEARGTKARWCEDGGQLRHEHSFTGATPPAGRRILWHLIVTGAKMGS